jgi:chemotaxis protein MotB
MKTSLIFSITLTSTVLFFACVPATKFKEVDLLQKTCATERDELKKQNEKIGVENLEMKQLIKKYEVSNKSLMDDSIRRSEELTSLKDENQSIKMQNSDMQEAQEAALKGNARETSRLMSQLQGAQQDLRKKEDALKEAEKRLEEKKQNLDRLTLELDKRDARNKELEAILFRKDSAVNALKSKVSAALMGFENNGLTVKLQNGKVYVSLDEKLLFKSGSISVDPKGVDALKNLAKVLEQNQDISVNIEGHTDNVPYKGGTSGIKDNWDLSAQRATSIVRIILDNSKIDPKRLSASGRGEFLPISPNSSDVNKQKNRRTEIILTPKLDELFKILENN